VYGYTRAALEKWVSLPVSQLESLEGLEQLRMLENGIPISVVRVQYEGRTHLSVDSPADVARVERCIEEEGELF
jgi:3-deoxy-manno-octulosonate cytidylyltransferase (CMP-KDO synthetase)